MREFTCIVCPNGCHLCIDEKTMKVTGNKCPRGEKYAISEITHPVRSICSTVKTKVVGYPVVSVRTDGDVDKDKIFQVMGEINKITITKKMKVGDVVKKNVCDSGVDIVLTTPMD